MYSDVLWDMPVSRLRDGLIPIPQEGGLSPHFGSHAFMNAIEDIKNWIGDGMDVQALLPMLSEARVSVSLLRNCFRTPEQ